MNPTVFFTTAFNPKQIAGCKLWLAANHLNLNDAASVSTWTDQSGNANNGTQATESKQPTFHTNIINGLPTVQFDGGDSLQLTFNTGTSASVFAVVRPTVAGASQTSYATIIIDGSVPGFWITVRLASTNTWGSYTNISGDLSSGTTVSANTNYLLETTATTNSTFLYEKGVQKATRAENSTNASPPSIGDDIAHTPRNFTGHIAELITYNSVLSSANRILVQNYLIGKYNL